MAKKGILFLPITPPLSSAIPLNALESSSTPVSVYVILLHPVHLACELLSSLLTSGFSSSISSSIKPFTTFPLEERISPFVFP